MLLNCRLVIYKSIPAPRRPQPANHCPQPVTRCLHPAPHNPLPKPPTPHCPSDQVAHSWSWRVTSLCHCRRCHVSSMTEACCLGSSVVPSSLWWHTCMRAHSPVFIQTHSCCCCCCRCRGGWEQETKKVRRGCLATFRWLTLAAPDQLPNWVNGPHCGTTGGNDHLYGTFIKIWKTKKNLLISCNRICRKNEPNKCEEHCEKYYMVVSSMF
jgi:hypothetical protein